MSASKSASIEEFLQRSIDAIEEPLKTMVEPSIMSSKHEIAKFKRECEDVRKLSQPFRERLDKLRREST